MTHEDFPRFFHALNDKEPFPWQSRLARSVLKDGRWPGVIAMPTAAGKTGLLDIAIFALAANAGAEAQQHRSPRRIFYIVDRRIIVDEVLHRAGTIADKLRASRNGDGILREVADHLARLGGESPLEVFAMRGGMYRDSGWSRSPLQPVVCVSTVDQAGSRLLFRGYGLRNGACNPLPIHAGLLANDALLILDEAHLSRPFAETLAAIRRYREWAQTPAPTPWEFVQMTATPRPGEEAFTGDADDVAHPILSQRLGAHKWAVLVSPLKTEVPLERDSSRRKREIEKANIELLVEEMCQRARELRGESLGRAHVIALIFNRVAAARAAFDRLRTGPDAEAILLTGRTRPYDRDRLIQQYRERLRAGRMRDNDKPLYVIATQCIEVGADFDFDAMATECAALDALRQRFGRLDRLGELGQSRAVIVVRHDQLRQADDPVYGPALASTWKWLEDVASKTKGKKKAPSAIDFGATALDELIERKPPPSEVYSPARHAPVMLPAHLDLWSQTSPAPAPDPEVSIFLHGPEAQPGDVQIVWRADIDPAMRDAAVMVEILSMLPPSSMEALPVPFAAARSWLASLPPSEVADIEGMRGEEGDLHNEMRNRRRALRWRGRDNSELVDTDSLRPGDTIVVSASYGGADQFGWNPESNLAVRDIGDMVAARRGIATLRLHPALLEAWTASDPDGGAVTTSALKQLVDSCTSNDGADIDELLSDLLTNLLQVDQLPDEIASLVSVLRSDAGSQWELYPDATGVVIAGGRRARELLHAARKDKEDAAEFTDEDDTSSLIRQPIALREHSAGVKQFSSRFAAGLPPQLRADLELAAWLHDIGKADPRFQLMLHGGDEFSRANAEQPLAKSCMAPGDPIYRQAHRLSCYPDGGRHEAQSVALINSAPAALANAHDRDLVLHLVGSHHGCGRPFIPVIHDPQPVTVSVSHGGIEFSASSKHSQERLDSGVSDRFWLLVRRYGWYGLAYLEALLRLADHRCSEREEARGE